MNIVSSFVDERLKKNSRLIFGRILDRKKVSLRQLANDRSETVKFERWFRNKNVSVNNLVQAEQARLAPLVKGRHVLAIQDTTELNYEKNSGRAHGLGTVGNGIDMGFFVHPMLVIDANTSACLGSAAIHIENRLEGAAGNYKKLPIEEKESYRWISTAKESKKVLSKADCITFIGDRENDIYEFIDRIPDEKTHILTRVWRGRRTEKLIPPNSRRKNQHIPKSGNRIPLIGRHRQPNKRNLVSRIQLPKLPRGSHILMRQMIIISRDN